MADAASDLRLVAHNVVHMRAEPRSGTELVSQTLMGRTVRVLKTEGAWSYIESDDAYRGWAESRWLAPAPSGGARLTPVTAIFADLRAEPRADAPLVQRLPILCGVEVMGEPHPPAPSPKRRGGERGDGGSGTAIIGGGWGETFTLVALPGSEARGYLPADALAPLPVVPADTIAAYSAARGRDFLGTPYLWGGSSSFGLDCSGFVQLCYRLAGVVLRRDADIQRDDPRFAPVPADALQPGDLVFFGKPDRITHIGMAFEDGTFIHSAGGAGVIVSPVGDDRYWPTFVDARRLDPSRAADAVTRFEAEDR